jgi:putative Mg2+ transporter-C (MgtC) family protein
MPHLEIALKLLLAIALGGLVGLERESSQKPAGFRTHILICLGSAMMMILSGLVLEGREYQGGDIVRIAAGVITGIGFMGAGTIIISRGMIIGLTTAATLWAVAGLGLVIGAGYYMTAFIFSVSILLALIGFGYFEEQHLKKNNYHYTIKAEPSGHVLTDIKKTAMHEGIKFQEITFRREKDRSVILITFPASEEDEQKFNQSLSHMEGIQEIKIE